MAAVKPSITNTLKFAPHRACLMPGEKSRHLVGTQEGKGIHITLDIYIYHLHALHLHRNHITVISIKTLPSKVVLSGSVFSPFAIFVYQITLQQRNILLSNFEIRSFNDTSWNQVIFILTVSKFPTPPQKQKTTPPQNKHGTWKWTLGKGDSYWKPSFPGSMLIFGGVTKKRYLGDVLGFKFLTTFRNSVKLTNWASQHHFQFAECLDTREICHVIVFVKRTSSEI